MPFVAAGILETTDFRVLPVIAYFERYLAWAWLTYLEDGKEKHA